MTRLKVAVAGATGLVGQTLVSLLEGHPWFRVAELIASERSLGTSYLGAVDWRLPGAPPADAADLAILSIDAALESTVVFSCLPSSVAAEHEIRWVNRGHHVFSNARAHRLHPRVPLLVPEVNEGQYELTRQRPRSWQGLLVTNPNCSVAGLVIVVAPLLRRWDVLRVYVTTMQAASGAGVAGLDAPNIPGNIQPFIPDEEDKLSSEPRRVLGTFHGTEWVDASLELIVSCHRVPVERGHMLSLVIEGESSLTPESACEAWAEFRGSAAVRSLPLAPACPLRVHDEPDRPQPRCDLDDGGMTVHLGRVRGTPGRVVCSAVVDNLVRGAAGAALLNAEYSLAMGGLG